MLKGKYHILYSEKKNEGGIRTFSDVRKLRICQKKEQEEKEEGEEEREEEERERRREKGSSPSRKEMMKNKEIFSNVLKCRIKTGDHSFCWP